jgi:hypothetical protein
MIHHAQSFAHVSYRVPIALKLPQPQYHMHLSQNKREVKILVRQEHVCSPWHPRVTEKLV